MSDGVTPVPHSLRFTVLAVYRFGEIDVQNR
jgi:hypothetical protein